MFRERRGYGGPAAASLCCGPAPLSGRFGRGTEAMLKDVDVVGEPVFPHQRQRGAASDHQVVAHGERIAEK